MGINGTEILMAWMSCWSPNHPYQSTETNQ